jgi:glycosyltransferase involved in cell wall biosynthesis
MKVIQIIDTLKVGGAEKIVLLVANKLTENNIDNAVMTTTSAGELESQLNKSVRTCHLHRRSKFDIRAYYHMYKLCRQYDIIHIHSFFNLLYFSIAWLFLARKKVCYHEHNSYIVPDSPAGFFQKLLLPHTFFIGVSSQINLWALKKARIPANKIFLLPNSIPSPMIPGKNEKKEKGEVIKILQVGNFREAKHYEYSVKLCAAMKGKGMKVTMDFVGKINEPGYLKKVKDAIAEFGVTDNIRFIHDCNDVSAIVADYDISIHTCIIESGPIILIEYLYSDQVFLSYDTGEVSLICKKYYPEFFINNFDVESWIIRIKELLENKPRYNGELRKIYEKEFSPDTYIRECLKIYGKALSF